ncbi:MAG: AraC family transcriptional regulator ligand-binding domain-containing protein [Beijerinckiaceae bacterium]
MDTPDVRVGNIAAIGPVLQSLNINVSELLEKAGLAEEVFCDSETRVSLHALDQIASEAEILSGCDHIGLLVGAHPADLGLPSYLLFNAPDLRTGLRDFFGLIHFMHEGGAFELVETKELATIRYSSVAPALRGARHVNDCVIAQMHSCILRYCGPHYHLKEVRLPREHPADLKPYRKHFTGAKLTFDADEAALDFSPEALEFVKKDADSSLYKFLKNIAQLPRHKASLPLRVKRHVSFAVANRSVKAEKVAEALGITTGELAKELRRSGKSLRSVISDIRHQHAKELLLNTGLSVTRIAIVLGYSDHGAFSRAFLKLEGVPPGEYRSRR